jgi:hypothetical protein
VELLQAERAPSPGEFAAVSVTNPKTAALVYDRVWGLAGEVPEGIRFGGLSESEIHLAAQQVIEWIKRGRPKIPSGSVGEFYHAFDRYLHAPTAHSHATSLWAASLSRTFAAEVSNRFLCASIPVFGGQSAADEQYRRGERSVIWATISDLQIVDEDSLQWNQVLEFRRDVATRKKYGRFIHWLDANMIGRDQAFISDEVSQRLDDYTWAIRKHGLKTMAGTISALLDEKSLLAVGSLVAGGALLGLPKTAFGVGVTVWAGKALVEIGKGMIDVEDARRGPGNEVAYIYEVKKRLG